LNTPTDQKPVGTTVDDIQLYINGNFVDARSGERFENFNPFTNQVINRVAEGREEDIAIAVKAAKEAFEYGPWGKMKLSERLAYIRKIADLIDQNAEEISYLESLDTGLPISQTKKQIARAAQNFRFYAEMVSTRMVGEAYQVDDQFLNYTIRKPVGVAGLITPWNAPFMLETWKVAPALATGNTVVLQPAELSHRSGRPAGGSFQCRSRFWGDGGSGPGCSPGCKFDLLHW
jgi:5-carboxymethyl-2-hydroxymuconic-semialdehyde dehydrogenase